MVISKVLVGSLGDYDPATTNEDIGPRLHGATNNFPGADSSESREFQADYTNVFYRVIIPEISITPTSAVAYVGGSNVQYTVTGTNITNGVTWSLIPDLSGSGGAQIQPNADWRYQEITPGNIATNYKVRATSKDNTNFYDEADLTVVGLRSPLQYRIGTNTWADMPDPLYVCKDTAVDFKAIKLPADASWPAGKPVWTFEGLAGGSGMETNIHGFNTLSTKSDDYKIVTAEYGNTISGRVVVLDIKIKSVGFGGTGEHTLRKDGESWNDDSYTSDGNTNISDPVWADTNLDGTADTSEPVCYTKSSSPLLTAVIHVSPTAGISSISSKLKATSIDTSLAYLKDVSLSSGDNESGSLTASGSLWNYITNSTVSLSWSISLDNGNSYQPIGQSANSVFVVYDTPSGIITAKRANWCTILAAGKNTLDGIGDAIGPDATGTDRFDYNNSVYETPKTWPWSVMDGTNANCGTLSWLMKYELDCVGATGAEVWFVYPRHASWTGLSHIEPPVQGETNQNGGHLRIWIPDRSEQGGAPNNYEGCCVFQSKWWMGGTGRATNSAYAVLHYMADPNTNGMLTLRHQCWHNDTTNFVEYPEGVP